MTAQRSQDGHRGNPHPHKFSASLPLVGRAGVGGYHAIWAGLR